MTAGPWLTPARRRAWGLMAAAALAPGTVAMPATAAGADKRTTFHGQLSSGTGRLAHARGRVTVILTSSGSGRSRQVTLTLRCHHGRGEACVRGRVRGTATAGRKRVPDTGVTYDISASGRVAPLGHVSVTGSVTGTGFIRMGHFALALRLSGPSSAVSVNARSGPEPGFSSPF